MCPPKQPKTEIAAAAPPPEQSAQAAQGLPENVVDDPTKSARRGRNALLIPLTVGGTSGGTGVNVPG